jgi:hypothetical protein
LNKTARCTSKLYEQSKEKPVVEAFSQEEADSVFDNFMSNRVAQGAKFADFVSLLNMKAVENINNEAKMELLTEILNDVKLFLLIPENNGLH